MKRTKRKNPHWGSMLENFLDEEGIREAVKAETITRVIAWQLSQEMKRQGITRARLTQLPFRLGFPPVTTRKPRRFSMESALTSKGQATIPKAIREHLGLKPGDRLKFFMHPDGSVVLLPKRPASILRGIVRSRLPVTIEDMGKAAAAGAVARPRRR